MSEITLEKIDIIKERTNCNYAEAKEALEKCDGNIVDALIYIEQNKKSAFNDIYTTKDEFINWLKDAINKGNVTRVRIRKDDKVVVDIPVNAGIVAGIVWPPLIALGLLTAVFMKVTVEITKNDGTTEVVNTIISDKVKDVKDKVNEVATEIKDKIKNKKESNEKAEDNVYQYTVKFEDIDDNKEE